MTHYQGTFSKDEIIDFVKIMFPNIAASDLGEFLMHGVVPSKNLHKDIHAITFTGELAIIPQLSEPVILRAIGSEVYGIAFRPVQQHSVWCPVIYETHTLLPEYAKILYETYVAQQNVRQMEVAQ